MSNYWEDLINNHYGEAKLWIQIAFSFHQKMLNKIETLATIYDDNDKSIVDFKNELNDNIDYDKFKDLYNKYFGRKDSNAEEIENYPIDTKQIEKEALTDMKTNLDLCEKVIKMDIHSILRKMGVAEKICRYWSLHKSFNENKELQKKFEELYDDIIKHVGVIVELVSFTGLSGQDAFIKNLNYFKEGLENNQNKLGISNEVDFDSFRLNFNVIKVILRWDQSHTSSQ